MKSVITLFAIAIFSIPTRSDAQIQISSGSPAAEKASLRGGTTQKTAAAPAKIAKKKIPLRDAAKTLSLHVVLVNAAGKVRRDAELERISMSVVDIENVLTKELSALQKQCHKEISENPKAMATVLRLFGYDKEAGEILNGQYFADYSTIDW